MNLICQQCGIKLSKNRRKFCSNKCKDTYHNINNPRGIFRYANKFPSMENDDFFDGEALSMEDLSWDN